MDWSGISGGQDVPFNMNPTGRRDKTIHARADGWRNN